MRERIRRHVHGFWPGVHVNDLQWDLGPIKEAIPDFHVCEVERSAPGEPFVYVSAGASSAATQHRMEFFLMAGMPDPLHVEALALVAYFHATSGGVDVGRVLDLGRPWCEGSALQHFLVSVPYPYGPAFEYMDSPDGPVRLLWLLPIIQQEAEYAAREGCEGLEDLLEQHEVDFLDPARPSVV